jgi:hypothetical protein
MPVKKSKYRYHGPVYGYGGKYIEDWDGETWAPSEAKALANLSFRYKTNRGLQPGTKINLDADCLFETTAIEDGDEIAGYHQITLEEYMNEV